MFYFVEVEETTEGMNAAVFSQRGPSLKSKIQNNMLSNIDSFFNDFDEYVWKRSKGLETDQRFKVIIDFVS